MSLYYKTTECVSPGHPDKVADFISDSVLDAHLAVDPYAKVACETMVKDDLVILAGEITSNVSKKPDLNKVVREALTRLGYTKSHMLFNAKRVKVLNLLSEQSPEINQAVVGTSDDGEIGAGDQGIMWGYATDATPTFMPLGMFLAKGIMNAMEPLKWDVLFADCKTQVTIAYDSETRKPVKVSCVVISCLHDAKASLEHVRSTMKTRLQSFIDKLPSDISSLFTKETEFILNRSGRWVFGGPEADSGLTGRKIVVDAYGADCEVGGGAFSGKDGTKVDRSGAYAARFIAKNIVAAGLARECKVQLGYVIGKAHPVSFNIDFMGTGCISGTTESYVEGRISSLMDGLTPKTFIKLFRLTESQFANTVFFGHFGVSTHPWEELKLVPYLKTS